MLVATSAAGVVALQPGCSEQYALLLTVRGQPASYKVQVFDLRVLEMATRTLVLEKRNEKVDPADPERDIAQPGQELKIAIELPAAGNYLVHVVGRSFAGGAEQQFALRDFDVKGPEEETIVLIPLRGDADGDGVPACGPQGGPPPGISCPPVTCARLDCDDADPTVHPFAAEVCGDGKDNDCSAGCAGKGGAAGEEACADRDGDLVPDDKDCAPDDPCRSPKIPEAATICNAPKETWSDGYTKACRAKLGSAFKPPLCGDGVDADCDGKDTTCFTDADCDGHAPPQDCDDTDAKVNPAAAEACDGKDNNCNKATDEGCVPCDVDGDLHASVKNTDPGCTLPKDDPDDFDAGVSSETTKQTGGAEGGTALGALREHCSSKLDKNGVMQIAVDHDGDGKTAAGDGCPTAACDADGDGFAGAQCSPPSSMLDCDDSDPTFFPGAPDLCGDTKAQNCLADAACACDADGDGYCPPASAGQPGDCDDTDKAIHPWALERCDGVDNDCDGLVDEGNPDASGALIATNNPSCNDDKDGECAPTTAPLSGFCACSAMKPNSTRDEANRVKCTDEDLSAKTSPRCFGALQPQPERCEAADYNCDGQPFKLGDAFVGQGAACGVDTGACVAGKVESCDLSKTVAKEIKAVLQAAGTFSEHWVCSADTVLPKAEVCNGVDDDCDGTLTPGGTDLGYKELGEADPDKDGYLGCAKCKPGELPAGVKGCNDCDNAKASVYPGALEKCNGLDDNCKDGLTDDGADDCTAPYECCATVTACINVETSLAHCGGCDKACDTKVADTCNAGVCVCGAGAKDPCKDGRNCVKGVCTCSAGGLCSGCCENGTCKPGDTDADCGAAGATCKDCGAKATCISVGTCCSGCVTTAGACAAGTSISACGKDGDACADCGAGDACGTPVCSAGTCGISAKLDETVCPGGLCYKGTCCTGCWDGNSCEPGDTDKKKCGKDGEACVDCGGKKCINSVCQ